MKIIERGQGLERYVSQLVDRGIDQALIIAQANGEHFGEVLNLRDDGIKILNQNYDFSYHKF
jgi:hypothetical protein